MTDYDALVKALREHRGWALNETLDAAADAIEEMSRDLNSAVQTIADLTIEKAVCGETRWIPVTERLPEFDEEVLVARDFAHRYEVRTAHIAVEVDGHSWWSATNVTHWMPLPTPPKEEKPNFCEDCNWYEPEEMYCFRQGSHSYDNGNCELWEPRTEPPKEEA